MTGWLNSPFPKRASRPRKLARFIRDRRGAVAVEFAVVAIPFFFLIANICEQGLIMLMDYSLQRGTESASRQLRINTPTTQEAFRNSLCEAALLLPNCEAALRVQVQSAKSFGLLTDVSGEMFEPGVIDNAVRVRATYRWRLIFFPSMSFLSNAADDRIYRIIGVSVFRNEP